MGSGPDDGRLSCPSLDDLGAVRGHPMAFGGINHVNERRGFLGGWLLVAGCRSGVGIVLSYAGVFLGNSLVVQGDFLPFLRDLSSFNGRVIICFGGSHALFSHLFVVQSRLFPVLGRFFPRPRCLFRSLEKELELLILQTQLNQLTADGFGFFSRRGFFPGLGSGGFGAAIDLSQGFLSGGSGTDTQIDGGCLGCGGLGLQASGQDEEREEKPSFHGESILRADWGQINRRLCMSEELKNKTASAGKLSFVPGPWVKEYQRMPIGGALSLSYVAEKIMRWEMQRRVEHLRAALTAALGRVPSDEEMLRRGKTVEAIFPNRERLVKCFLDGVEIPSEPYPPLKLISL